MTVFSSVVSLAEKTIEAGQIAAERNGYDRISTALKYTGYGVGEAATFAEDHPVIAAAAFVAAAVVTTALAPALEVTGAAVAGTDTMTAVSAYLTQGLIRAGLSLSTASYLGGAAVDIASQVAVDTFASAYFETGFKGVAESFDRVFSSLDGSASGSLVPTNSPGMAISPNNLAPGNNFIITDNGDRGDYNALNINIPSNNPDEGNFDLSYNNGLSNERLINAPKSDLTIVNVSQEEEDALFSNGSSQKSSVNEDGSVLTTKNDPSGEKTVDVNSSEDGDYHSITFSEAPVGSVNPTYNFQDNTVSVLGNIVTDSDQPLSPAVAANTSYIGPIFINFKTPVTHVDFDAGYFDNLGSTTITFIGVGGNTISTSKNSELGIVPYSIDNDEGISAINVVNSGYDGQGFSVDNLNFSGSLGVFTPKTSLSIALTDEVAIPGDPIYTFTVTRAGDTSSASSVGYGVTGTGANPITASDLPGGVFPVGQIEFAPGQVSQTFNVDILGGFVIENPKTFMVTLLAPSADTSIENASVSATTLQPSEQRPTPGQTIDLQPFDTIFNHMQGNTTFIFNPGNHLDVIHGFKVRGNDHDIIELPPGDFKNLADVLRNTGDIEGSAFITDPITGDAIRLAGIDKSTIGKHLKDIMF